MGCIDSSFMEAVSAPRTSTVADDARSIAWWLLVGAAAGAVAGFVIGGVGGRLAMLLLRLTSPESVIGVISDDGFEIGVVTTKTLNLLFGMTMLGAANGVLYAGAAVVGTFALVLAAVVGVAALAIRRSGGGPVVARVARIVVPIGLIGLGLWGGFNLVSKAVHIT